MGDPYFFRIAKTYSSAESYCPIISSVLVGDENDLNLVYGESGEMLI